MKAYLSVMVSKKSYILIMLLAFLASCAPIEPAQIEVSQPAPVIQDTPKPSQDDKVQEKIILADNQTGLDNGTSELVIEADAAEKTDADEQAKSKETVSADIIAKSENTDKAEEEPKTERKIVLVLPDPPPPPKPIEPLNPAIFTGLHTHNLEKRLGRPDRQFNEQALDVWHYEEPHCHALFFIRNSGDGAQIMHVDLRANLLDAPFDAQICFADFGQRAEALLDRDKR